MALLMAKRFICMTLHVTFELGLDILKITFSSDCKIKLPVPTHLGQHFANDWIYHLNHKPFVNKLYALMFDSLGHRSWFWSQRKDVKAKIICHSAYRMTYLKEIFHLAVFNSLTELFYLVHSSYCKHHSTDISISHISYF